MFLCRSAFGHRGLDSKINATPPPPLAPVCATIPTHAHSKLLYVKCKKREFTKADTRTVSFRKFRFKNQNDTLVFELNMQTLKAQRERSANSTAAFTSISVCSLKIAECFRARRAARAACAQRRLDKSRASLTLAALC
ncbi:hypothetical protein EVAR_69865_1 [Eumeta japonica]|uniref:Uncharacterized protein n=1 Tax=Eumeta variegata TaxID=151549 RepID=A0A4C2ADP9_EUMVA|nr:hypothetical protein EVAR_69865_1 [Eumeta japonica]